MSDSPADNNIQSILEKAQVGGDLTVGDIQQIIDSNVTNQIYSGDIVTGDKNVTNQTHSGRGDNFTGNKNTTNIYGDNNVTNIYNDNAQQPFEITATPHNIPAPNTIKFVGRAETIFELNKQLQENNRLAITAVKGMGGIGKTELATQYSRIYLLINKYQGGICWLRARDEDNIGLQVLRFAQTYLNLNPPDNLNLQQQVKFIWSQWQSVIKGKVLIAIDDMTDYEEIEPYLPPQPSNFKILITTRLNTEYIPSIPLDVLKQEDAIELLKKWIGEEKINEQIKDVEELCWRLGNLPLALNLVGRYVQKRKISIKELLSRLEEKGLSHQSLVINKQKEKTAVLNIERGVAAAFELSWDELHDSAKQLGCVISIFALAPIKWKLVEDYQANLINKQENQHQQSPTLWQQFKSLMTTDIKDLVSNKDNTSTNIAIELKLTSDEQEKLENARVELESLHLIQLQTDDIYQLHQLIREYFQDKLEDLSDKDILKRNFVEIMVNWAYQMPQTPTVKDIEVFTWIIPHMVEVANKLIDFLKIDNQEIAWTFTSIARFYNGQGLYELALPWYQKCLLETKQRLGEKHPDVATSLNNLAELYRIQGKYEDAEPLYLSALQMTKTLLGEQHPLVATSLNNLAQLYRIQGKYEEAEPLYLSALHMRQTLLGEQHPLVATSLNNLAGLYKNQGKYEEVEPLLINALQIYKTQLGKQHPDVATSLNNLAELYRSQGKYKEAEPLYLSALHMRQTLLGEQHPDVATSLNNLAGLYESLGKYEEAEPLYLSALHMRQTLLGEQHPSVAASLNNLAGLYKNQGKYEEAEPLYLSALQMTKTLLGEQHPSVATSLNNLAQLYRIQGKYEEAEPLYLSALHMTKTLLGEQHPDVATSLNNLATLYYFQGKYGEAESLYINALTIAFNVLGQDHPNTQGFINNFAYFLQQVIKANKIDILSNDRITQDLLQKLQGEMG